MSSTLVCRGVSVAYSGTRVLSDVSIEVAEGETLALLGPSGSGKTTLMYAIAGFVEPTEGEIEIAGTVVYGARKSVPPEDRDIGLVFQNYGLWPHLSALDTVAYPLRRSGKSRQDSSNEAGRLLDLVGIAELSDRKPAELSGGQQQRVGLARALARNAGLYLFDEPTAHLDAFLRTTLQDEILHRRRETGAAAVYSTHDSAEALAIADRVAILRQGTIIQLGTPTEVYERPADEWAAHLTGTAAMLDVEVSVPCNGGFEVGLGPFRVKAASNRKNCPEKVKMLVRPEWISSNGPIEGPVMAVRYRGSYTDYSIESEFGVVGARLPGPPQLTIGDFSGWSINRGWIPDK